MKCKILFLLPIFLFVIFSLNSVSAWGNNLHTNLSLRAIALENNTLISQIIQTNIDACYSGLVYADVGIFYYYTNFKQYAGLHNYNVVDEMLRIARNDRDRAFAYCYKLHLAEDSISHNFYIPAQIKKTKLPNYIIHPIMELKVEGYYLTPTAQRLMERHKEFDWLVEQATGKDWSVDADNLNSILGGGEFYEKAYAHESTTWFGRAQNGLYKIIALFVSDKSTVDYQNLAIQEARGVLRGETNQYDPSGEAALNSADRATMLWLYIGSFVAIVVIFIISWRKGWIGWHGRR